MKIGILSDTHGLLRPEVLDALAGCEAILHGGDIDRQEILDRLRAVAPVHAVRGNADGGWAEGIPVCLELHLAGFHICMAHKKKDLPEDLSAFDLAVFGHSHRFEECRAGSTLLLNPGSCGARRFRRPVTLATAELSGDGIRVARVDIPCEGAAPAAGPDAGDLKKQIGVVLRETQRGRAPAEIARRHGWDADLVEQIARLYVTHPGVTAEGIMTKMGL